MSPLLDADGWSRLRTSVVREESTVLERAVRRPLAEESELFDALVRHATHEHAGVGVRMYVGGQRWEDPLGPLAIRAEDRTLEGWFDRLTHSLGTEEVGLIVNNVHALDERIWKRSVEFVARTSEMLRIPPGGAATDLILGRYRRGFFQVHKDDQHVFTFVVQGEKRILTWPFESFAPEGPSSASVDTLRATIGPLDTISPLPIPRVLEGTPADILYWPASEWHVAQSDGSFVVTVAIGLLHAPRLRHRLERMLGNLLLEPTLTLALFENDDPQDSAEQVRHALQRGLESRAVATQLQRAVRSWQTGFGFSPLPKLSVTSEIASGDVFIPWLPQLLDWRCVPGTQCIDVFVAGRIFEMPNAPWVRRLLQAVSAGRPVSPAEWTRHEHVAEAEAVLQAIRTLVHFGALRPKDEHETA